MKMAAVQVGMRLESDKMRPFSPITVTEITERGFKYKLDAPVPNWPSVGSRASADGHEHYGYDGQTDYELLPAHVEAARKVMEKLCADPEVWRTHGMPTEEKYTRIERAIADAILEARNLDSVIVPIPKDEELIKEVGDFI